MEQNTSNNTVQAFWLSVGSLFSFGFSIISSMILSRYLSINDYGTYKQVLYVYNSFLAVFTLGLPKAFSYFLPRVAVNQAKSLIKKITNLFFILGALFSLLLFFFAGQIAVVLNNSDLELAIKVFAVVPFMMLPTMGLEAILSTFRMTKFMTIYTVSTRVLMLICVALPVVLFHGGFIQAIIGFVVASSVSFLLALYFKFLPVKNIKSEVTLIKYLEIFKFSLPLLYASLWGVLINSADQFFISRYFRAETFAEFSNGAMDLPFIGMILGATSTVLSPVFSKLSHNNINPKYDIFPIWISVFKKSALLIYPLLTFSIVFADVIMISLYGEKYYNSAVYFIIFNIASFFKIIIYAPLIINIGKVKYYQKVYLYSAIILIPLEYFAVIIFHSPYVIVIISVVMRILRTIVFLNFISKYFKVKFMDLFPVKLIGQIVLPSVVMLIFLRYILINLLDLNSVLTAILGIVGYFSLFGIYSFFVKLDYVSIVKPLLDKFGFKFYG